MTDKELAKKVAKANMKYLEIDKRQYAVYRKLMDMPMNQWPGALDSYIRKTHGKELMCGDAISCWVAEWVKTRPDYVNTVMKPEKLKIRVLRFD